MSKTKSTSLQTVKTAPNTTVIYDAKDTSQQTQDFMTDLGNYFESLNVSKDVRETTTSFYLGLLGMERNLFELGIKQVMNQIETGAENIDNPLLGGFLGDLGYLEYYAPSLYDYFNDMFGENKTLDRSEVLTNLGIEKDPSDVSEGPILTEAPSLEAPPVFTADSQRIVDPIGSVGSTTEVYSNDEDDTRQEESVEIPLDTIKETELTEDTVVITDGDDSGDTDEQPPLTGGDDSGDTDEQPPLTSEPIIDDDVQEEPPLVGPPGTDGVDGVDGAAGAAGAPGSRGGYMGGLSYQLPQFVGVQYQPKDYTVELNRIINESLFKGMI